jgi:hypothetical protein
VEEATTVNNTCTRPALWFPLRADVAQECFHVILDSYRAPMIMIPKFYYKEMQTCVNKIIWKLDVYRS